MVVVINRSSSIVVVIIIIGFCGCSSGATLLPVRRQMLQTNHLEATGEQ